jgi:hypothetical protein
MLSWSTPEIYDKKVRVEAVGAAQRQGRAVMMALEARVVECGLGPVLMELMRRKVLTALNGRADS